jgi:hypothetical protein
MVNKRESEKDSINLTGCPSSTRLMLGATLLSELVVTARSDDENKSRQLWEAGLLSIQQAAPLLDGTGAFQACVCMLGGQEYGFTYPNSIGAVNYIIG